MTREEAIKIFHTVLFFGKCDCSKEEIEECLKMAIKALRQEPIIKDDLERHKQNIQAYAHDFGVSEEQAEKELKNDLGVDCISRADAIKAMQDKAKELKNEDTINGLCGAVAILFDLPSVTTKNDLGVDCISRQAVLDGFEKYSGGSFAYGCVWGYVKNLPSVTPKNETITYLDGFADGLNMANNSTNKMLDKIRAEIIARDRNVKAIKCDGCGCFFTAEEVLDILDKYKAGTEGENDTDGT